MSNTCIIPILIAQKIDTKQTSAEVPPRNQAINTGGLKSVYTPARVYVLHLRVSYAYNARITHVMLFTRIHA